MRRTRRYTIGADGAERPVWASRKRLEAMGREWAHIAIRHGQAEPIRVGNTTHDEAAAREFARLKKEGDAC